MPDPQTPCVYRLKVVLRGISPMVWRRLLLRSDHPIADLHYAIQIAMGWSDAHLNRFHLHGKDYGVSHEGGLTFSDDPNRVRLAQFGLRLRERFLYEYDFYDGWLHDVRLENVLPLNSKRALPACTGGKGPAPPGSACSSGLCGGWRTASPCRTPSAARPGRRPTAPSRPRPSSSPGRRTTSCPPCLADGAKCPPRMFG